MHAQRLHANNKMLELANKSFQEMTMIEDETIKIVVRVGLLCSHRLAAMRPTMSELLRCFLATKRLTMFHMTNMIKLTHK